LPLALAAQPHTEAALSQAALPLTEASALPTLCRRTYFILETSQTQALYS
jgi:hypothetical protein